MNASAYKQLKAPTRTPTRYAMDESTCTPGSVSRTGVRDGGHPSRPAVAGRLERPTRRLGRAALKRLRRSPPRGGGPFGLAPGGVYRATPVTRGAGGLLPHRFTLTAWPRPEGPDRRRSVFCGTVP